MTPPRLEACYFPDPGRSRTWPRLSRVLTYTARQHCPDWRIRVEPVAAPVQRAAVGEATLVNNTRKLDRWAAIVAEAADGDRLLLLDADTLILRPLDPVWDHPFDLAYTIRPSTAKFPFNGGVVFLRIGPAARAFVDAWKAENAALMTSPDRTWRREFGGVNQASFARVLTRHVVDGLQVHELTCQQWNCEDSAWASYDPDVTRIVHVKGDLRQVCFFPFVRRPALEPLASLWRAAELEAKQEMRRTG